MAAERHGADTELLVLPADHLIEDVSGFARSVAAAQSMVRHGALVTFGIVPTHPETGYGYIETGDELSPGCHRVVRFVEKPNAATAKQYVASGRFLWNSGMFCFRADAFLDALERHAPDVTTPRSPHGKRASRMATRSTSTRTPSLAYPTFRSTTPSWSGTTM